MSLSELFIIAVGLSMDAFAVAICKGLSVQKAKIKHMLITGLYFGLFQAGMPAIGYFVGKQFASYITRFDHWIAFVLLGLIGANMIRESLSKEEEKCCNENSSFGFRAMFPMAIATSIDALAIGVSFALLPDVNIVPAVSFIGITTFIFSFAGVKIGNVFGAKFESKAEFVGGVILILMGLKILLEHLGVINF
ncbi:MAG: manganese efflux pump [Ruminococcaceae bacterium]|nr:manganese efflux pump [Oscillospiraceae bacterium]